MRVIKAGFSGRRDINEPGAPFFGYSRRVVDIAVESDEAIEG